MKRVRFCLPEPHGDLSQVDEVLGASDRLVVAEEVRVQGSRGVRITDVINAVTYKIVDPVSVIFQKALNFTYNNIKSYFSG